MLSGAFSVLTPTFRKTFGLSLVAVSLLDQVLSWVALIVEPPAALLIDVRSRRVLMTFGAAWLAAAMLAMGIAPTYAVLLAGFAAYGVGSGPLAHTADVVLVESHPDEPEEIFAKGTFLDTLGALLAPLLIAGAEWAGVSWRYVLAALAGGTVLYAITIGGTPVPAPAVVDTELHLFAQLRANVRDVLRDPTARRWLLFGLWLDVFEAPNVLRFVWLHEHAGMSQGLVAVYAAAENVAALASLALMGRWLARIGWRRLVLVVCIGIAALYPAWLAVPGLVPRFVVGLPIAFLGAMLWPIGRARALVSVPGRAGAVSAVTNLLGVVPFAVAFGVLAEWIGLTEAMLLTTLAGVALVFASALSAER